MKDLRIFLSASKSERPFANRAKLGIYVSALAFAVVACGKEPGGIEIMSREVADLVAGGGDTELVSRQNADVLKSGFTPSIQAAVSKNDRYRSALALEVEARSKIGVAQSARRPQIGSNATVGGVREMSQAGPDQTTTGLAGGLSISQLLYDGGASSAAINRATAEAIAAGAAREIAANEILLEASRAWIDVWQSDHRLRLLRDRTQELDAMVAQMERMAANGLVDKATLDSVRREIVGVKLEETRLEADLREASVRFEHFFDARPQRLDRPTGFLTIAEVRASTETWQQAPALIQGAAEFLVAKSAVESAEAEFRPQAHIKAGLTSPMDRDDSTDATVGIMLNYTFGDGGRRKSQLESTRARLEAADARLADLKRTLRSELSGSLERLFAIERSKPLIDQQIRLSASEAETARSQIATGQSNLRQLIDAELENYRARDRQITIQAEQTALMITIAARTGHAGRKLVLMTHPAQ